MKGEMVRGVRLTSVSRVLDAYQRGDVGRRLPEYEEQE